MKNLSLATISFLALIFNGCGGGSGDKTNPASSADVLTGVFVDAPVEGLKYKTASQEGFTNENGQFKYKNGETIKFSIGDIELGNVSAKKIVTPLTLAGDTNLNNISQKAQNIAILVQSLDENPNDNSKIKISESLKNLNVSGLDIAKSTFNIANVLNISEIALGQSNKYEIVDSATATDNMKKYLQTYLYNGSYTGSSKYTGGTRPASMCSGDTTLSIMVTDGTKITGATSTGLAITGLSLTNSTIEGYTSDGTHWHGVIDEDGVITGNYNFGNGGCIGTFKGTKD